MSDNSYSAYRDLVVWQKSMDLANAVIDLTEQLETDRKHYRLVEQLVGDSFEDLWHTTLHPPFPLVTSLVLNMDNGPENYSRRT